MENRVRKLEQLLEDHTLRSLIPLSPEPGLSASQAASLLSIHRTDASRLLSDLNRDGKALRVSGKPVRYLWKSALEQVLGHPVDSGFLNMSQLQALCCGRSAPAQPSIFQRYFNTKWFPSQIVDKAKAAISYPPRGLHTLILGPTGSGKSFLAEIMYRYGLEIGRFQKGDPLIRFNCADYANNSQLLLSQLFGHEAGAYTDARGDKKGLVELAGKGILFLDEVHALPKSGQEMLFSIIDKGVYRRMGETSAEHSTSVLLILATNHHPKESLETTFLRRIPMIISLPPLSKRSPMERLHLIKNSFSEESKLLGKPIIVDREVLNVLMRYECPGNIGQLQTDIKNICSRSYLSAADTALHIKLNELPEHMILQTLYAPKRPLAASICRTDLYVFPPRENSGREKPLSFPELVKDEARNGQSAKELRKAAETYLRQFQYSCDDFFIESPEAYEQLEQAVAALSPDPDQQSCLTAGLYFFLEALRQGAFVSKALADQIHVLASHAPPYPSCLKAVTLIRPTVDYFGVSRTLTADLLAWLHSVLELETKKDNRIYLLSSHEEDNETIARTVNQLLGIHHVESLSFQEEPPLRETEGEETQFVMIDPEYAGQLLSQILSQKLKQPVHTCFSPITTTNVVVLSNKIIQSNWNPARLEKMPADYGGGASQPAPAHSLTLTCLACDENDAYAKRLKQMLENMLQLSGFSLPEVSILGLNQCGGYDGMAAQLATRRHPLENRLLIDAVNFVSPAAPGIFIPFEELIGWDHMASFTSGLQKKDLSDFFAHTDQPDRRSDELLCESLSMYSSFVDSLKIRDVVDQGVIRLGEMLSVTPDEALRQRLLIYSAFLVERVISSRSLASPIPMPAPAVGKPADLICHLIEDYFEIVVPPEERALLGALVFARREFPPTSFFV